VSRLLRWLDRRIQRLSQPRMVWGYTNPGDGKHAPRTRVSNTAFLYYPKSIQLADNVFVWHYTILDGTAGLSVGEGTQIGAWVGIFTHSSHLAVRYHGDSYQETPTPEKQHFIRRPVRIGRYCFIGARSLVMPGVTIGDGVLVAAGSIVERDVPDFAIMKGTPAIQVGDTRTMDAKAFGPEMPASYYRHALGHKPPFVAPPPSAPAAPPAPMPTAPKEARSQ
jgi:acetyltransferase-like isoleucine patch superfamily enzyme